MQRLLRSMQAISLEVEEGNNIGTYPSLVLDFEEGRDIVAGVPLEKGREVRLEPGTSVRILVAQVDGLYVLRSRVVRRDGEGPSLHLAWPASSERVQRRSHVRVEVLVRAEVRLRGPQVGEERLIPAASIDLSAGGVRLSLGEPLDAGTQVALTLHLPELGSYSCEARVVRGGPIGQAGGTRHWAAFEFVGMLESVRKELTRFVFDVQREQMRKGVA